MTLIRENEYKWYEKLAFNVIKCGPIPRHIAIIMDGNRRFAKTENIEKIEGHSRGFDKLSECLGWCLELGVKEVTAFAFSIENFKRSPEEVSALMDITKVKFQKLLEEKERLHENGVRIRILGNLGLLPEELQQLMSEAMLMTEQNNNLFLNIAFAYTSREEITNAIQTICQEGGNLEEEDITDELVAQCLYTKDIKNPDLLIRTSGESRLSDFLMWQVSVLQLSLDFLIPFEPLLILGSTPSMYKAIMVFFSTFQLSSTVLYFPKTFWPAITIWHLLYGIFCYQRSLLSISGYKTAIEQSSVKSQSGMSDRAKIFLHDVDMKRRDRLVRLSSAKHKGD